MTALAGLHGPSWCDPVWLDFAGIAFARPDEASGQGLGYVARMGADITLSKLGDQVSTDDGNLTTAMDSVTPWLLAERGHFALLHGGYRLDNMLFNRETISVTGLAARPLASGCPHATSHISLPPASGRFALRDRRAPCRRVSPALSGYGVTDYDRATCWG